MCSWSEHFYCKSVEKNSGLTISTFIRVGSTGHYKCCMINQRYSRWANIQSRQSLSYTRQPQFAVQLQIFWQFCWLWQSSSSRYSKMYEKWIWFKKSCSLSVFNLAFQLAQAGRQDASLKNCYKGPSRRVKYDTLDQNKLWFNWGFYSPHLIC